MHFKKKFEEWPIVVKPLHSAATDGVTICKTETDIRSAFSRTLNKENAAGLENKELLIQEFLDGEEYVLDVVGLDGKFYVTDIWAYHKREIQTSEGTFRVYDTDELLPYKGEIQSELIEYGLPILKVLENLNGPSHMEIIMTKRGPILVEVGARIVGAKFPKIISACTNGMSQIEVTLDAYFNSERFNQIVGQSYVLYKNALSVALIAEGGILKDGFFKAIKQISSFFYHTIHIAEGEALPVTRDLFSSPGMVALIHESKEELKKDREKLSEIVKEYSAL